MIITITKVCLFIASVSLFVLGVGALITGLFTLLIKGFYVPESVRIYVFVLAACAGVFGLAFNILERFKR